MTHEQILQRIAEIVIERRFDDMIDAYVHDLFGRDNYDCEDGIQKEIDDNLALEELNDLIEAVREEQVVQEVLL